MRFSQVARAVRGTEAMIARLLRRDARQPLDAGFRPRRPPGRDAAVGRRPPGGRDSDACGAGVRGVRHPNLQIIVAAPFQLLTNLFSTRVGRGRSRRIAFLFGNALLNRVLWQQRQQGPRFILARKPQIQGCPERPV